MITNNVIYRTFHITIGDSVGTCFTIDVDGRQYLVSARHLVKPLGQGETILIYHENQWKQIRVTLVGHCPGEVDVSVLATNLQLSPTFELEPTARGLTYAQEVYFLGFPYGMTVRIGELNRDFPMPFVKKAIVSCMYSTEDKTQIYFLDGHNNPGFSGGPVVFKEPNRPDFNYRVAAVISGFRWSAEPVYEGDQEVPLVYRYNTGIIVAYGIKHAVDLIQENPRGYELEA
ncbi:MAG: trypsin-like peptidase domain-containing protein [Thermodesulfobacteriota bacterium]